MTICVSVKIAEGLIFAADSTVTLQQIQQLPNGQAAVNILQTFSFANKVSHFKDYPIGIMSWGLASLEARSIQSLIMELEYTYLPVGENNAYSVEQIARNIADFIGDRYEQAFSKQAGIPPEHRILGVLIGGYSHDAFFPTQYIVQFEKSRDIEQVRPDLPNGAPNVGVNWYGMTDALIRLIRGFDENSLNVLIGMGADQNVIQQWIDSGVSQLPLVFDGMPLQDAIDFAEYCVQVVIGRFRFGAGVAVCGGDIDIAVMRPRSFEWAQRKRWSIKD